MTDGPGTEPGKAANTNTNTNANTIQNVNTNTAKTESSLDSMFGPVALNYQTTNKEGRAAEIREIQMDAIQEALEKR
jgi:hypothetical protein